MGEKNSGISVLASNGCRVGTQILGYFIKFLFLLQLFLHVVNDHITKLFTSCGHRDWGSILECVEPIVLDVMNSHLSKLIEMEEIQKAIF